MSKRKIALLEKELNSLYDENVEFLKKNKYLLRIVNRSKIMIEINKELVSSLELIIAKCNANNARLQLQLLNNNLKAQH